MNAGATKYTSAFFSEARRERTRLSAEAVVPWILQTIKPQSVVDVGCGTATWLSVFHQLGVADILGIDGRWVETAQLEIPSRLFWAADLNRGFPVTRRFDLTISLEVAEHIEPKAAPGFVETLIAFAPVIFFSAAIPQQGGTGHLNEQWPSYWQHLFVEQQLYIHGFTRAGSKNCQNSDLIQLPTSLAN